MKKILILLTMVFSLAIANGQSPQWFSYDSGATFSDNLYTFTYRDDLYVSEEVTGNLWKSVNGSWEPVVSPGFGIKSSKDFQNEWWVSGDSVVSVFTGSNWTVKKTVSGQIYCSEISSDSKLYIGGFYTSDSDIKNIMWTDGSNFYPLDTTTSVGIVQSLIVSPFNGNMQICQSLDGPPTTLVNEWTGTNFQTPVNLPIISSVGKSVVCNSKIYYQMFCIDPSNSEDGYGHRIMSFDGTNWKKVIDDYDGTVNAFSSDSAGLIFSCFGNIAFSGDTVATALSGLYQLTSDTTANQIGETLYGAISSISIDADSRKVISGWFGPVYGAPLHADVLVFAIETGGTDAIETENLSGINLFPNPANNFITVTGLPSTKTAIDIYDVTGRTVAHYVVNSLTTTLDVSNFPNGVYLVHTNLPNGKTIRFVKN